MTKRYRVGVVGCGFFSQNHLHAWKSLQDQGVDLVAVCDLSNEKATQTAQSFAVPGVHTDIATMIAEENLDLIDIVTQVNTHKDLVFQALDAGLATIIQKPFGRSLTECEEMVAKAQKTNAFLAVHENFRFQYPHLLISDILASGQIGDPTWGRISFRTGYDIYSGQPYLRKEERFILTDVGVHVLDLARVYCGEVEHLSAELQRRVPGILGEDTATLLLRHTSSGCAAGQWPVRISVKPAL